MSILQIDQKFFLNDSLQLSAQSIALHEKILNAFSALCRKVETNQLVNAEDYQYWGFWAGTWSGDDAN